MAKISLHGDACQTNGDLPSTGAAAPAFTLTGHDLSDVTLASFSGKKKLLNIIPSIDTPTCALSTRKFNETAAKRDDAVVLIVSADLPFAQSRFCAAENTESVRTLSTIRSSFANDYGVNIVDGPLANLTARAVVVIDENDQVIYTELVSEIGDEPNYDAAIAALS